VKSEETMSLKEILEKIVARGEPFLLSDRENKDWEASTLLQRLSEPMLKRKAFLQPGIYFAEINDSGYLGSVLFKVKQKA
jgi:hypothetical protein